MDKTTWKMEFILSLDWKVEVLSFFYVIESEKQHKIIFQIANHNHKFLTLFVGVTFKYQTTNTKTGSSCPNQANLG